MEHGLIILIEAVLALDRRLQKPLAAVIPELQQLRASPHEVLTQEPVIIGPRRPYAVAIVLGCLIGLLVLFVFVLVAIDRPVNRRVDPTYVWAAGLAVVVTTIASAMLLLRWLRGGSAVLQPQGVEFFYRGRSVFCPWAVFQVGGAPYQPDHKRLIMPVNDGVPIAIRDGPDSITARLAREIKSRPLSACAEGQVALADLYEVRLAEFGQLLMHLGLNLGNGFVPVESTELAPAPLATAEGDGWLRIRLTRLPFPPVCCRCGEMTRETIAMPLDARNKASIEMPLCRLCQVERSRRRRAAFGWGVGFGIGVPLLWIVVAAVFLNGADVCLGLTVTMAIGIVIGLIVGFVLKERAEPVHFREYAPANGTVAMLLKPGPDVAAFRSALGVVEVANPAEDE